MAFKIGAWVPYWQYDKALFTVEKNLDIFGDILLFNWDCYSDGSVKSLWYDPVPVKRLKETRLPYYATFVSKMSGAEAADLFDDKDRSKNLAKNMITAAREIGAHGLDLDFETINFGHSGDSYSRMTAGYPRFVALLKKMAGSKLKVSTTIPARWSDNIPDWGCYDYKALGDASDLVRIMAYDHHWSGGPAGPVAPLRWCRQVVKYTASKIDPSKVYFGVAAYGYDWPTIGNGKTVASRNADSLAAANNTSVRYRPIVGEGYFKYGGNVVWVGTSIGMAQRLRMSQKAGMAGIAIWSLGDESSDAFDTMRRVLKFDEADSTPYPGREALSDGASNEYVKILATRLQAKGYLTRLTDTYDQTIMDAVKAYKKDKSYLVINSKVGRVAWKSIVNSI